MYYRAKRLGGGNTYIFYIFLLSLHFTRFFCSVLSFIIFKDTYKICASSTRHETKFLDVIGTKFLRVFLLAIHSRTGPPGYIGWRAEVGIDTCKSVEYSTAIEYPN
jgi:hypothetical protein